MDRYEHVICWGDTHGEWSALHNFLKTTGIRNSLIIQVGDFGLGYRSYDADMSRVHAVDKWLATYDCTLFVIRGNHDDPDCFCERYCTNRVKMLPDYTHQIINDHSFLFVGGATSIDRIYNVEGKSYWRTEPFSLKEDYKTLPECDVLITHSSPEGFYPTGGFANISNWLKDDPALKDELIQERADIRKLYNQVLPKKALVYGHFHAANVDYIDGVPHRCLDINEFWELKL